jgi:hypothetical protein
LFLAQVVGEREAPVAFVPGDQPEIEGRVNVLRAQCVAAPGGEAAEGVDALGQHRVAVKQRRPRAQVLVAEADFTAPVSMLSVVPTRSSGERRSKTACMAFLAAR